jgi:membrane protein required for colicin V production
MTLFDYAVLTIVGVSVLVSLARGLVREVLALSSWILAFLAASVWSGAVAAWLADSITNDLGRSVTAFAAVFLGALLAMSAITVIVAGLVRKAGLGLEDRLLGGVFGFARGVMIVLTLVLLGGLTAAPRQPAWNEALLSPPFEALARTVKPWLPQIVSSNLSYD